MGYLPELKKWDLSDWNHHLTKFREYLDLSHLDAIFGGNKRAQLQAIQYSYHQFLIESGEKSYLLTESLMKMGNKWPPNNYVYSRSGNGLVRARGDHSYFDNRFLISVFSYPHIKHQPGGDNEIVPELSMVLLGLRIFQFIAACEQLRKQPNSQISPLSVGDLITLGKLFEYKEEFIIAIIEEYAEFECLSLHGGEFPMTAMIRRFLVSAMPKLFMIFNTLIYDIGYLNLCSMRIPLSKRSLTHGSPYFMAASLDDGERGDFIRWMSAKLLNPISLAKIIDQVNSDQYKLFNSNLGMLDARLQSIAKQARLNGMFEVSRKIYNSISRTIDPIISSIQFSDEKVIEAIENNITAYLDIWTSKIRK